MNGIARLTSACGLLIIGVVLLPGSAVGEESTPPKALQIALPRTLFRDIPEPLLVVAGKTYQSLMQQQIGMPGNVVHLPDAMEVAAQLQKGDMHLGVFQGFEFAWVKAKYPNLEPLVVAVPQYPMIEACLIVKATNDAKDLIGLKGQQVAIPNGSRDHVKMYFEKLQNVEPADGAICQIVKAKSADDALEDIIDGALAGAMVDAAAFASFTANKPGRARKLKVLSQSDPFPPGVIAFKKAGIDEPTLKKCRDGLLESGTDARASVIMRMMKLKGFESVPANFDVMLKKSIEAYPGPVVERASFKP